MTSAWTLAAKKENGFSERLAWDRYLKEISHIPPLTQDEETQLARHIRAGDDEALKRLVEAHLRFAVAIALEYQGKGIPILDLVNEANTGLIMAARRFDEQRGCKIISYAVWWIRQAIRQAFADQVRFIRLPRLQVEALQRLDAAVHKREQASGETVSVNQVMMDTPLPTSRRQHLNGLVSTSAPPYSLNAQSDDDESGQSIQVEDTAHLPPDEVLMDEMMKKAVNEAVLDLPEREANVLRRYYGMCDDAPRSLDEIGRELGLSRERVRQIKDRGLQRLRHMPRSAYLRGLL